jgi:hypothetical protein
MPAGTSQRRMRRAPRRSRCMNVCSYSPAPVASYTTRRYGHMFTADIRAWITSHVPSCVAFHSHRASRLALGLAPIVHEVGVLHVRVLGVLLVLAQGLVVEVLEVCMKARSASLEKLFLYPALCGNSNVFVEIVELISTPRRLRPSPIAPHKHPKTPQHSGLHQATTRSYQTNPHPRCRGCVCAPRAVTSGKFPVACSRESESRGPPRRIPRIGTRAPIRAS